MRGTILSLMLLLTLPNPARAEDTDAAEMAQAAVNALVDTCLKVDWETACIGRAALTCFVTDIAPIEPIPLAPKPVVQIEQWCDHAEQAAWQSRLDADTQAIKDLLADGPALREFEEQQHAWEAFFARPFPSSSRDSDSLFMSWTENEITPLLAVRSLQVESILDDIRRCENGEYGVNHSFCEYLKTTP